MTQTVKWLPKPEKHDYQAAEDYLSLLMPPKRAAAYRRKLAAARDDITHRKAKDILRASQLDLLGEDNKHVASDLRKAASGAALSPILLLRGTVRTRSSSPTATTASARATGSTRTPTSPASWSTPNPSRPVPRLPVSACASFARQRSARSTSSRPSVSTRRSPSGGFAAAM